MKKTRIAKLVVLSGLALVLSACGDGDPNGSSAFPFSRPDNAARSVSLIANQQINLSTDETSSPILINDLPINNTDTNETGLPSPL